MFSLISVGLGSNIFFFIWTNFGVWLMDSWGIYTKDLSGLIKCYIFGLPFLKNQFVSSLIFIPTGYLAINYTIKLVMKYRLSQNTLLVKGLHKTF